MSGKNDGPRRTWTEEIEVAGSELVERIKAMVAEGNVRELRVKAAGGQVIFETPLTVGVLAGGAVALAAPWLAIIGALAALVARVKLEVVREEEGQAEAKPARRAARKRAGSAKPAGSAGARKRSAKPKRTSTGQSGRGKTKTGLAR